MADENLIGVKTATAVAGFMGAVASLSINKPLTRFQAIFAVLVGLITSAYLTPLIAYYLEIIEPAVANGMAFVVGLISMHIITAIMLIAKTVSLNPFRWLRLLRNFDNEEKR